MSAFRSRIAELKAQAAASEKAGRPEQALAAYTDWCRTDPADSVPRLGRANMLADLGHVDAALQAYDQAIALDPRSSEAHHYRALVLAQTGRSAEALEGVDRSLAINPDNRNAAADRATILQQLGRFEDALAAFDALLARYPAFAIAHNNRGNTLLALDRVEEAIAAYDAVLRLQPAFVDAICNRAVALARAGRAREALAGFDHVLRLQPHHAKALEGRSEILIASGPAKAAAPTDDTAGHVRELAARARSFRDSQRIDEAIAAYRQLLTLDPSDAGACNELGMIHADLDQLDKALDFYDRSLRNEPSDANVHYNRAVALNRLDRLEEALGALDRAIELAPDMPFAAGLRQDIAMHLCDWRDFEQRREVIRSRLVLGDLPIAPFPLLGLIDDPAVQRRCAATYLRHRLAGVPDPQCPPLPPPADRLRIGYFSADFHSHATMRLLGEVLEAHDRDRFELTAFSFGPPREDDWRARTVAAVDRFLDVRGLTDAEVAAQARALKIDLAVDLKGYTLGNRIGIFAERPAAVQVSYLGYPGTLGAPFIDYILADRVTIPKEAIGQYQEAVVWLPDSYQPNARLSPALASPACRADHGLPDEAFVYCSFNQAYKLTPDLFQIWMDILRAVENSVLWLWVDNRAAQDRLRVEAQSRGIASERLIFAPRMPAVDHLARLVLADVLLDTLPYNAHTTASDALRMGLPVVTCAGNAFAARVAASLLQAAGMDELVTDNLDGYRALAIDLALSPGRLGALRARLAETLPSSPLFNPVRMARSLEAAYTAMVARARSGQAPGHIAL